MPEVDVVVVGGGPAGLTTAGALAKRGIRAVVLDRQATVGRSWSGRYDRLRLHTVRAFSGLAHHPLPRRYPRYPSKDQYAAYLQDYACHFDLDVRLNCTARRVLADERTGWRVETQEGIWRGRAAVVAMGHFGAARIPPWPGGGAFAGRLLHSSAYESGAAYAGKRALVVGLGNSGCEIAADLAEQGAASVTLSMRTPPPVVPRDYLGVPVQVFGILLSPLPPRLADAIGRGVARVALGDLRRFGLERARWFPFTARRVPVIDVGFVEALKRGRITLRPGVAGLTRTGARFVGGAEEDFEVIVAATGFDTGLTQLLGVPGLLDQRGLPRFASGAPTSAPGLYFMGYTESVRGHLYEAQRDSRRLARWIERDLAA